MLVLAPALLLLCTAVALPGAPLANASVPTWTPAAVHQTACDSATATFDDDEALAPADWRQCAALSSAWATENGTFTLRATTAADWVPLARAKDCVLAVRPLDPARGPFTIGDGDVAELLRSSLQRFSHGTEVAVSGVVKCPDAGQEMAGLVWHLAKTTEATTTEAQMAEANKTEANKTEAKTNESKAASQVWTA